MSRQKIHPSTMHIASILHDSSLPYPKVEKTCCQRRPYLQVLLIDQNPTTKRFYPIVPAVNKNPDEKFAPRTLHPFFMLSWTRKCREPSLLDHPQSQGSLFLIKPRFFLVHSRKITPPYRQLQTMHRGGFSLYDYLCQPSRRTVE